MGYPFPERCRSELLSAQTHRAEAPSVVGGVEREGQGLPYPGTSSAPCPPTRIAVRGMPLRFWDAL